MKSKRELLRSLIGTPVQISHGDGQYRVYFPGGGDFAFTLKEMDDEVIHLVSIKSNSDSSEEWISIDSIGAIVRIN